jgi:type II secretory pathway predicted ATPase ExeA
VSFLRNLGQFLTGSRPPQPIALERPPLVLNTPAPVQPRDSEPGFSATASDQVRGAGDSALERLRLKLRSILTPSQPVANIKAFAGRRRLLTQVIEAIEDQRLHLVLYGSRGMGKTSLLRVLTQRARDARYLVVYSSCGLGTTFSDMFRGICEEIPLRFHISHRGGGVAADTPDKRNVASLLPKGELTPGQIGEVLSEISGTRVIVIVDEFDRSDPGEFRQAIADLMKNLSDRSARVQLIIAGVAKNLSELIEHIPSIQRNLRGIQIPPMNEKEVRQLFKIAQEQVGVTFSEEAGQLIWRTSQGWAYVASLLSHHAVLAAIRRKSMSVEVPDALHALHVAGEEIASRLSRTAMRGIQVAQERAGADCLQLAAKLHILGSGEFDAADPELADSARNGNGICLEGIQRLAADGLLIEARTDQFGTVYGFSDTIVPLYLWLVSSTVEAERAHPEAAAALDED